jgi:hypothetical protein
MRLWSNTRCLYNEINEEKHKLVHTINRSLDRESILYTGNKKICCNNGSSYIMYILLQRHGSFVWDKLAEEKAESYLKSINHPVNLNTLDRPSKPSPPSTFRVDAPATTTTTQIAPSPPPGPPVASISCKATIHSAPAFVNQVNS